MSVSMLPSRLQLQDENASATQLRGGKQINNNANNMNPPIKQKELSARSNNNESAPQKGGTPAPRRTLGDITNKSGGGSSGAPSKQTAPLKLQQAGSKQQTAPVLPSTKPLSGSTTRGSASQPVASNPSSKISAPIQLLPSPTPLTAGPTVLDADLDDLFMDPTVKSIASEVSRGGGGAEMSWTSSVAEEEAAVAAALIASIPKGQAVFNIDRPSSPIPWEKSAEEKAQDGETNKQAKKNPRVW
jgi:hypothetical protein